MLDCVVEDFFHLCVHSALPTKMLCDASFYFNTNLVVVYNHSEGPCHQNHGLVDGQNDALNEKKCL